MKFLLIVAVFTIFLAIGEAKRCRSQEDCDEGECCINKGIFRRGSCKSLAQKDEKCSEEQESFGFFDLKYMGYCPCAAGLSCEPTRTVAGVIKINLRCVADDSKTTPADPEPETEEPEPEPETEEPEPEPETEEPEPEPETEEPEPEPETEEPEPEPQPDE